jgi:hypothetical protein
VVEVDAHGRIAWVGDRLDWTANRSIPAADG